MPEINIEKWIEESDIDSIQYSDYWNDADEENKKEFAITGNNFNKFEEYVRSTGLIEDFHYFLDRAITLGISIGGSGVDLASGPLWLLPPLIEKMHVDHITCVEYSKNRLLNLGPKVIEHYNLPVEKITLALGSFYDIRIPAASLDFAILCQAFHHADSPHALLNQISKVLKDDGTLIIIGEPMVHWTWLHDFRHVLRYFSSRFLPHSLQRGPLHSPYGKPEHLIARSEEVLEVDKVLGDHFYIRRDYARILKAGGFSCDLFVRPGSTHISIMARKQSLPTSGQDS